MFTVIICDEAVLSDINSKYQLYLKPLLETKEIAFCAWNPKAKTLQEAVPDLEGAIKSNTDWRAVVVFDRRVESYELLYQSNPFDFVGTKKTPAALDTREQIEEFRNYVESTAQKAVENPLMKLSVWLCGYSVPRRPEIIEEEAVKKETPCSDAYFAILQKAGITPTEWETSYARAYRYDCVKAHFLPEGELFYPPKSVIAIAERAKDIELEQAEAAWQNHSEYDYSSFAEDNLYSSKLRCLVYQMPTIRDRIPEVEYFRFLATMLIFAQNDVSFDMFRYSRVYELSSEIDRKALEKDCNDYVCRLHDSQRRIAQLRRRNDLLNSSPYDDAYAAREFEAEALVPVKMTEGYKKDSLMCEYDDIGLSADCPEDELGYWQRQYTDIRKQFIRFLRQPQRSIKRAVEVDFVARRKADVVGAKRITDFQKEDIQFKLQEEEQNMIETSTSKVFDKKRYDEMLEKADREVKRGIAQRMTRKKTIVLGIVILALCFVGFIPLLISRFNNVGTGGFSLVLISAALGVVAVALLICIFYLRSRLKDRFKGFNTAMENIYGEVEGSLQVFSKYLTHACTVMREFDILNAIDNKDDYQSNVFGMHESAIEQRFQELYRIFPEYIVSDYEPSDTLTTFDYDFDQAVSYPFDFILITEARKIPFLRPGTEVTIPVNYIASINLRREELYD